MLNLGNASAKDFALGQNLVERIDFGSNVVFDPHTNVVGNLPLAFSSRVTAALKNYRLYGTENGAGVETENLWNPHTPFTEGKYVNNVGTLSSDPRWRASDYISVNANTQYTFSVDTASGSLGMHAFYDSNNQFISTIPSGTQSFTTPENAAYARFSYRKTTIEIMLTEGSTAPASYIPPGYQIPLTNTSGVTENKFDKDAALLGYEIKNGLVVQKVDWFVSDFIEVNPDTHYMATLTGTGCLEYTSKDAEPTSATINQITGITTLTTTHYLRINAQIANIDGVMFTEGSTAPASYIPHRYTADYNIYIGSTKLGAEEYVDYAEQKVYKRTENLFNKDAKDTNNGYIEGARLVQDGSTSISSRSSVSEYIPIQSDEDYYLNVSELLPSSLSSVCFYDSSKSFISGTRYGAVTALTFHSAIGASYCRITYLASAASETMLNIGSTAKPYAPYLQPTDPPAPFPAITAYNGENTLSSTETVGEVTVRGRISPLFGTALTQANYDLITPVSTLYYPIYTTANGENIWTIEEVTAREYAALTGYDSSTLYLIMSGSDVEDAYVGSVECDKVYLGSTEVWDHYTYRFVEWLGFERTIDQYVITDFGIDNFNWTVSVHLRSGTTIDSNYNNSKLLGTDGGGDTRSPFYCLVSAASSSRTRVSIYLGYTWYDGITGHDLETPHFCQSASREAILTLKRGNSSFAPIDPSYGSSSTPANATITYTPNPNAAFVIHGGITSDGNIFPFRYCSMQYYEITVLDENDSTVHDLKPAERNDDVLGFYDTVTGKFYQNSGSGTLTKGGYVV